ncbi:hypothetical protein BDY21DRAFT_52791 [Lineolata rhizophorae]|uniref:BTB domain-containing protein n=1 Tax=Lineolata rhizophorae TaxID=578093 RepID=A0A6A6NXP3_9PEZI|nr:hypothetical protein BDY21DRAFT_52791 [Lineolata rhizophorae]
MCLTLRQLRLLLPRPSPQKPMSKPCNTRGSHGEQIDLGYRDSAGLVAMFRVGPEKIRFFAHCTIIGELSPALNTLVNGPFSEGVTGTVDIIDVLPEDFARLIQFAYEGTYDIQELGTRGARRVLPPRKAKTSPNRVEVDRSDYDETVKSGSAGRVEQATSAPPEFKSFGHQFKAAKLKLTLVEKKKYIFLTHARMYRLADYFGAESLGDHSASKLAKVLRTFRGPQMGPLVSLIQHVFTSEGFPAAADDKLKSIIVKSAVRLSKKLVDNPEFMALLSWPELAEAIFKQVAGRK